VLFGIDDDADPFAGRDLLHYFGIDPLNRRHLARPVGAIVRPADPGRVVRLPLGGHSESRLSRESFSGLSIGFLAGHVVFQRIASEKKPGS